MTTAPIIALAAALVKLLTKRDLPMPNHMSTIGFPFQGREGFDRLARQAAEFGETIASPGGSYRVWAPGAGAELWAQRNEQGTLIGLNPHFSGKARMRVGLTRRIHYPQSSALDGAFYGWAGAPDEDAESGEFPFVFDTPDYRSYDALSLPRVVTVQLVAFMHSLTAFEHEEAMGASDGWMNWMAPESCIPNGIFTPMAQSLSHRKPRLFSAGAYWRQPGLSIHSPSRLFIGRWSAPLAAKWTLWLTPRWCREPSSKTVSSEERAGYRGE